MEIVVSLLIIATSLLLLLMTIRQGLRHLETSRLEFQTSLSMQTALSALPSGIEVPLEGGWITEEMELRPGLKVIRLRPGQGREDLQLWISRLESGVSP